MNYSRSSHSSWRPFWGLVLGVARGYYKEEVDNVKLPYVVVPLKQRFKGETGETFHCVMVTAYSKSSPR